MIGRAEFLQKIDEAYALRKAGDKAGVASMLAPQMTFRIVGENLPIPRIPQSAKPVDLRINELIDTFQFHSVERLNAVVEGHQAAVHSRIVLSSKNSEKITAELYDLWTIDDDGKFTSLTQFFDAALVAHLIINAELPGGAASPQKAGSA